MRLKIHRCVVRNFPFLIGVLGIVSLAAVSTASVATTASGQWTAIAHPAPSVTETMLLLTDGTVMVHDFSQNSAWMRLSPDATGSYVNGTWSTLKPMNTARLYFASHVLPNGNVWVLGGEYVNGNEAWTNTGEIYDSVNNTWSPIKPIPHFIFGDDPSMLLPGGKILAGTIDTKQAFLYDIQNDSWSETGSKVYEDASDEESWVMLADGRVLTYDIFQSIGYDPFNGHVIGSPGSYAEVYDPQSTTWSSISPSDGTASGSIPQLSSIALGYELGPLLRLQDGRIFAIGATGHTAFYTPSTNTWTAGPDIRDGDNALFGADDAPGAVLPNGHVLFVADAGPDSGLFSGPTKIFDFDPATDTISEVEPPQNSNFSHQDFPAFVVRMLVLPTGQVLMTDASNKLWFYTPTGSAPLKLRPRIEGVTYDGAGVFTLTGQQLNGQNAGSAYGDDAEMDESYPIIHLTDGDGKVFYARTTNWSSVLVSTGVYRETVDFTLPKELTTGGIYTLSVSGAGIPCVKPVMVNITAVEIAAH